LTEEQTLQWQKIKAFELNDPQATLSFTDRLARENGWTLEYSLRTILEYKKFIFLICCAKHPLTPSDQVDQVWHLHLIYTRSYWIDFCEHTLHQQIHHGPTQGGLAEQGKFTDWYLKTKELYQHLFEQEPPADIWPDEDSRFTDIHFQRINRQKNWILKKPKLFNK
jgi:hypothetical protein